jgi:cell division septation protein DedD
VVVFGLALVFLYYFWFQGEESRPPAPSPPAKPEIVPRTAPEFAQKPVPSPPPAPVPPAPSPPTPVQPAPKEPSPPPAAPPAPPAVTPIPAPEVPPAEEKAVTTQEPEGGYGLLAGRFRRYRDAQRLLDKIKKQKKPGFIRREGKFYEVWVGPFPLSQEAQKQQKSLRKSLKISTKMRKYELPVPK